MPQPMIIAAIPAYNESRFVGEVVRKAREFVDEVVVVDDGSTDDTAQVVEAAGGTVVRHRVNRGVGEATESCFEAARSSGADVLVTLDGDGQHNPDEIPELIAPILRGQADLVIGSRFLSDHSSMPRYREFGIRVISFLYNFGSRVKISDAQSCFRGYGLRVLRELSITERGFGFSVQLLIQARARGLTITEVPISCIYHSASHNSNPVFHGLSVAFTVIKFRLKSRGCQKGVVKSNEHRSA